MPNDVENDVSEDESPVIRELREEAKRGREAIENAERLSRENVILRAGLSDLSDKQVKALTLSHEGDWTVEAIKESATELGFGGKPESPESPKVPAEELAAMDRVNEASHSAGVPVSVDIDSIINGNYQNLDELDAALTGAGLLSNVRDL